MERSLSGKVDPVLKCIINYKRTSTTLSPDLVCYPGKGANAEEKQESLQMADNFIDQMKYPRMKTQASRWLSGLGSCSITRRSWFYKAIYRWRMDYSPIPTASSKS